MSIPGLADTGGGDIISSEATIPCGSDPLLCVVACDIGGVCGPEASGDFCGASGVMVDCEEEREKVLARGARCVSLSSTQH